MPRPLFEYENYREFLADRYVGLKQSRPGFSYRVFSRMAGFRSPNFIKLVIDGKRNVSEEAARSLARALKLNRQETEFFLGLIRLNQAKSDFDRRQSFAELLRFKNFRQIHQIQADQYEYYSAWYVSAIRELVTLKDFKEDPEWIAKKLYPSIHPAEASQALELLLRLGLLSRNEKGQLEQRDAKISTGHEVRAAVIKKFHQDLLGLASKSLDEVPAENREVGAVSLGISQEKIPEIKKRIFMFRQSLLEEFGSETQNSDQVMQLCVQLFPLSRVSGGD
jgi:uncharacterized protein (TIGR02147 family)